ncbi:MAG: translation initiation factor IF-2 [Bacteroidales bacterium]|nr:translation initiation factor IF-2 [Bacteroidales bacterium]
MGEIRLNKLMKQFNVGLQDLVDFLNSQGAGIEENPNGKVSDEYMPALEKQFGADLKAAREAEERAIKMSDILEKSGKVKEEAEEEEPESVTVIRSNTLSGGKAKAAPEPKAEAKPEPEPEPIPEPKPALEPEPAPAPEPEPQPEPAPEPVAEKEPEAVAEPETKAEPAAEPVAEKPVEIKVVSEPAPAEAAPAKEEPADAAPEAEIVKPEAAAAATTLKVVGKIDLSQFDKKPKKRERITKGSQKVDVAKAGASIERGSKKAKQAVQQPAPGSGKRKRGERFKPAMSEAELEEMQKEIQKQVKETYAKMNEGKKNNFGAKYRKEKRELAAQRTQEEMEQAAAENKVLKVTEFVTVNDLATLMNNTPVNNVIAACMSLGLMVSINQRLDAEALVLVAEEFGYKIEFVGAEISEEIASTEEADKPEDLQPRPPVITVMGHVDHGKTSLLDYIRKTNVIAGEAGGITQHIGAYNVKLEDGRRITFLDTPGHEAFTAMRARGAQMTDLAIIIIAADDAVMPQTVEAINHAQAAGVPMVFAINKIDKPGAYPDKIYQQLSQMNILTENWGGKYQCQEISAKKGLNVDKLLEKVLLEADMLDLKANPNRLASGAVIESSLDKGRGYLATILVQNGTLHPGDVILTGSYYGRVKSMFNERGQKIAEAGPSTPVSVLGLNGAPAAGEKFNVLADEKEAKSIAAKREQLIRIQGIKTQKHMTLEEIGRRISIGNFKELNIIVKADVDGSVEALSDSLIKLSTENVRVNVIHKAVGAISESDILLAEASDAVIVGFNVRPTVDARRSAEKEGIEIRLYSVIYDAINEVKDGIEGMLEPEKKEEVIATAEVKQTFHISKVGTIAGCIMREGKMVPKVKVRLIRDGIVVYEGELGSLRIGKDNVSEVAAGKECGMSIAGYNDIKEGDMIEAYKIVEIKRTL